MGPAQLGDLDSPSTLPADPQRDLCPKCAQPWEAHQIIRPSSLTLALCPDGTAQQQ